MCAVVLFFLIVKERCHFIYQGGSPCLDVLIILLFCLLSNYILKNLDILFVWLIFEQIHEASKVQLLFIHQIHAKHKKHEQNLKPMHISVRYVKSKS
nr:MAG TPA: hypothetical protein [Caudoviricetes sp.]